MKLSIITINYNNAEGLRKTLASVAAQTFRDYEHIIVDGGSTDGSIEIIEAYASDVARSMSSCVPTGGDGCYAAVYGKDSTPAEGAQPFAQQDITSPKATQPHKVRWLSETDSGIYNAMNKGIKMANGEYLLFLNSGDYLVDADTLSKVFQIAKDNIDVIYGDIKVVYNNQEIIKESPDVVTFQYLYSNAIFHSGGSFIKKSLFVSYGLYDENLRIVSDWKFFVEIFILKNVSYQHINLILSVFDLCGISTENQELMMKERMLVLRDLFPERILLDYEKFSSSSIKPLTDYSKKELLKTLLHKIFRN